MDPGESLKQAPLFQAFGRKEASCYLGQDSIFEKRRSSGNVIGKAMKDGEEILIIGESKAQLSRSHLDRFIKRVKLLEPAIKGEKFPLTVTHLTRPGVVLNRYLMELFTKVHQ